MNTPTEVANITYDSIQAHGPTVIRYDTRCYFNVRSKADISQLNLPHGTDLSYLKLACMTAFSRSRQTGIQCQMSVDGLVETAPPNDQTVASGGRNE